MTSDRLDRPDLGAMLHRLTSTVVQREIPLLRAHQLEMWDYVVLAGLEHAAAATQSGLALAVGRDKTRLIVILDRLEARGLLLRTPDPEDRRNRIVTLTEPGRALLAACRREIRALEAELLSPLAASDRAAFLRALTELDPSGHQA